VTSSSFLAIDLTRCSVNVSGQLNVFWRLTGRRVFARLGMRAITATIKVGRFKGRRFKLRSKPAFATSSPVIPNTIGMVAVADFAASPEGSPPAATIAAICRLTCFALF
jgi:hypothetical protein